MKKKIRLNRNFAAVMKGRAWKYGPVTIFATSATDKRIGIGCKKGIKGAVKRNRLKRYGREAIRSWLYALPPGKYVLIISAGADYKSVSWAIDKWGKEVAEHPPWKSGYNRMASSTR